MPLAKLHISRDASTQRGVFFYQSLAGLYSSPLILPFHILSIKREVSKNRSRGVGPWVQILVLLWEF